MHSNNSPGQETDNGWEPDIYLTQSIHSMELEAPADVHSEPRLTWTTMNGSCKNPWTFSKLVANHLTVPDNYVNDLLKNHPSTETISMQINGLTLTKTELLTPGFKSLLCFMRQEVDI